MRACAVSIIALLFGLHVQAMAMASAGHAEAAVASRASAHAGAHIPSNVVSALTTKFRQAKIRKWSKEKEDGKDVYDIEFTQDDKKFEADIFADGTFHNWEQQIAASELPPPVVQTVARQFPKAAMKEIMAVTEVTGRTERLEGYEIVVQRAHKKDVEMTIAPDGKILEGPGKEK
jgi:hypothetical protein